MLSLSVPAAFGQGGEVPPQEETLVHVNITMEFTGPPESVIIAGRVIPNYNPKIVDVFPTTGIVLDSKGHVLVFLGYRWVDMHAQKLRIEVIDPRGRRHPGTLVGIDQNVRVAVVLSQGGELKKTPLCERCEINEASRLVLPVMEGADASRFATDRIQSVSEGTGRADGAWTIQISRPMSVIGAPLLNRKNQVLAMVADQPSQDIPSGPNVNISVLTVSQLLNSANRIIKAGGDIESGWLGVWVDSQQDSGSGIVITKVEDDSPARKAGLRAGDVMVKWNGKTIRDPLKYIDIVENTPVGSHAVIEVLRQGKAIELSAVIGSRKPRDQDERLVFDFPGLMALPGVQIAPLEMQLFSSLGVEIVPLTPQLADFVQVPWQPGLFVASVKGMSPFDRAGVMAGDVILDVDGVEAKDPRTVYDHIKSLGAGSRMALRLLHRGVELSKTVQLPKLPSPFRRPGPR